MEQKIEKLVSEFLDKLKVQASIRVDIEEIEEQKYLMVDIEGDDTASKLIGYHGKVLAALKVALQMFVSADKSEGNFGVLVDVNGYHAKREDYIRSLAQSAVDQVQLTMQPMELLPMVPAERRVVHMVVKGQMGVVSHSIGEGDDRRVIIKPVN